MGRYIVLRLLGLAGVMLAVSLVTFVLMHSVPGGPFDASIGDKPMPQAIKDQIDKLYGLDRPLYEQYFIFIKNAVRLDFGTSYIYINRKVTDIYPERWPYTIQLALLTLLVGGAAGLGLGIVAAVNQKPGSTIPARSSPCSASLCPPLCWRCCCSSSSPSNWAGCPPAAGTPPNSGSCRWCVIRSSPSLCSSALSAPAWSMPWAPTTCAPRAPRVWAKPRVMLVHVFKNALTPIITVGGPMVAGLLTGSFFVESMFRIPGVGALSVSAIQQRDYTMIMATTLIWTGFISLTYVLTDIAYALVDPRITFVEESNMAENSLTPAIRLPVDDARVPPTAPRL